MPGENYPGKLWMQAVTTADDASTYNTDGIQIERIAAGNYKLTLDDAIDINKVRITAGLVDKLGQALVGQVPLQPNNILALGVIVETPTGIARFDTHPALVAAGAAYHAQYAAGAPIMDLGPFTLLNSPFRTAQIVRGVGSVAATFTIKGKNPAGAVGTVVQLLPAGAATHQISGPAWSDITEFSSDIDPGGTTDLQAGIGFEVSGPPGSGTDAIVLAVDGVIEAPATAPTADTLAIVPTTAPDGTKLFTVRLISSAAASGASYAQQDAKFWVEITRLHF